MTSVKKYKTAVLISGSGTNLQAIIDAQSDPSFPVEISLVLSNKANAYGLTRAQESNIETATISHKDYSSREEFDASMNARLSEAGIEFVCLAGFMRILTDAFVDHWSGRMLNIHPSILPSFRGHNAHEQVIASSVAFSGCTVHAVTPELDGGPIVAQAVVPRLSTDDEDQLSSRVRDAEHVLYPLAIRSFLRDGDEPPTTDEQTDMMIGVNPLTRYRS